MKYTVQGCLRTVTLGVFSRGGLLLKRCRTVAPRCQRFSQSGT